MVEREERIERKGREKRWRDTVLIITRAKKARKDKGLERWIKGKLG